MPAPDFTVEIAFSSVANPSAWTLGVSALPVTLGDATTEAWSDVTPYVESIVTTRGKSRELDEYAVGRCTLNLQNITRRFDPLNLSGPYVSGGETQVKPGKPVRVRVTDPATAITYHVFRGVIKDWVLDYSGDFSAITQALASDSMAELIASVDVVTSAGFTGAAISEVLEDAGIAELNIDAGSAPVQSMTFTGTAQQALRVLEQTEQGHVYSEAEGGISFSSRGSLQVDTRSVNSQATFGGPTGLPFESVEVTYDSDAIKNKARVTRQGGVLQEATNTGSIASYGERLITLTGMACATDADALLLAQYLVGYRGEPAVRFESLKCAPERSAGVLTTAVSTKLLDRLTINFTAPGASSPTAQEVFVIGISHSWAPPGAMRTTFRFMPTDAFGPVWFLGVGELGDTTGLTATALGF